MKIALRKGNNSIAGAKENVCIGNLKWGADPGRQRRHFPRSLRRELAVHESIINAPANAVRITSRIRCPRVTTGQPLLIHDRLHFKFIYSDWTMEMLILGSSQVTPYAFNWFIWRPVWVERVCVLSTRRIYSLPSVIRDRVYLEYICIELLNDSSISEGKYFYSLIIHVMNFMDS